MKNDISFWQTLDVWKAIDTVLDLLSGSIHDPPAVQDGLCSSRFRVPRSRLGFAGRLGVPVSSCVIVWGHREFCHVFRPGTNSLRVCPPGQLIGQLVDMSQRNLSIHLSGLHTRDFAQVSIQLDVAFNVDDPRKVVQAASLLQTLNRRIEGTTRQLIESFPHSSLLGDIDTLPSVSKATLERKARVALNQDPALEGLRILNVKVVRLEGDPARLDPVAKAILAKKELSAEEAVFEKRRQLAIDQHTLILLQTQAERRTALAREQAAVDETKRQAYIFRLETPRREFQREEDERQLAHEREMARIKALEQILAALADPRHSPFISAPYAYAGPTDGQGQVLS